MAKRKPRLKNPIKVTKQQQQPQPASRSSSPELDLVRIAPRLKQLTSAPATPDTNPRKDSAIHLGPSSREYIVPGLPVPGRKPMPEEKETEKRTQQNRKAQRDFRMRRTEDLRHLQQNVCALTERSQQFEAENLALRDAQQITARQMTSLQAQVTASNNERDELKCYVQQLSQQNQELRRELQIRGQAPMQPQPQIAPMPAQAPAPDMVWTMAMPMDMNVDPGMEEWMNGLGDLGNGIGALDNGVGNAMANAMANEMGNGMLNDIGNGMGNVGNGFEM